MRFYPFGSSSLNQIYNLGLAVTSSLATYAESASYGLRAITASYAISGTRGLDGQSGQCSYPLGPQGDTGSVGFTGTNGGVSLPLAGSL